MTSGAGEFRSLSLISTRWPLALASGHLIPGEVAAITCELRNRSSGAANLKFLSVSPQVRYRNFKFKAAPETNSSQSSFDCEVRIRVCCDCVRTSESELWSQNRKSVPCGPGI